MLSQFLIQNFQLKMLVYIENALSDEIFKIICGISMGTNCGHCLVYLLLYMRKSLVQEIKSKRKINSPSDFLMLSSNQITENLMTMFKHQSNNVRSVNFVLQIFCSSPLGFEIMLLR